MTPHLSVIRELAESFVPVKTIALKFGVQPRVIDRMLDANGIRRPGYIRACDKMADVVLRMSEDGARLAEIGRAVGTSGHRVREFLEKNGIVKKYSCGLPGPKNHRWNGGRTITKDGYVKIWVAGRGRILEHRFVMEGIVGRPLLPREVVHHLNKKRDDNRPDNLQLFESNGAHLAHELRGQCPKWSPEGKERTQIVNRRRKALSLARNHGGQEHDVPLLP